MERFTAGGALALVPRADQQWTIIWARPRADGERLLQLDTESLQAEINAAAGGSMAAAGSAGQSHSYRCCGASSNRVPVAVVAIGNAAQDLHQWRRRGSISACVTQWN